MWSLDFVSSGCHNKHIHKRWYIWNTPVGFGANKQLVFPLLVGISLMPRARQWSSWLKGLGCPSIKDNERLSGGKALCWAVLRKENRVLILQLRNLSISLEEEPCIGFTQENSIENSVQDGLPYIQIPNGLYKLFLTYPKRLCVCLKVNMCFTCCMTSFDVTCCVTVWSCHPNPNPSSKNRIMENKLKRKIKMRKENRKILSPLLLFLTEWT